MTRFAPLPNDPAIVPSIEQVAAALAGGLPAPARGQAEDLLRREVLPWALRDAPTAPRPRALVQVVYEDLVAQLSEVAPEDRLGRLQVIACDTAADRLLHEATSLAVARYLRDHPRAAGGDAWRPDAARFGELDAARLGAEARQREAAIQALERSAPPHCQRAIRAKVSHARLALGSAQTGSFATATAMLADFLRSVGEKPQSLDIH